MASRCLGGDKVWQTDKIILLILQEVKMGEREEGIREVGNWIENQADETDYSSDEYEGQAWLIYPAEVKALKEGKLPSPKDRYR